MRRCATLSCCRGQDSLLLSGDTEGWSGPGRPLEAGQKGAGVQSSRRSPAGEPSTARAAVPGVAGEALPSGEGCTGLEGSVGEGLARDSLAHGTRCVKGRGGNTTLSGLSPLPPRPPISQEMLPPAVPQSAPHLDEELLFEAAVLGKLAEGLELRHLWKLRADWP